MSKVNNMAARTARVVCPVSSIFYLLSVQAVSVNAYYCDNDRCSEEEYCCGDNTCCPSYKVWDLWYFWCGVLFFMFLLTMCALLWRHRFLSDGAIFFNSYSYTAMHDEDGMGPYQELPGSGKYIRSSNKLFTTPLDAPHLYNQISSGGVKLAAPSSTYAQAVGMRESH